MAIDLTKYGITDTAEIIYNPSYEDLYKDEMDPSLEGYDKGVNTELGAVNVMTGIYTGRSPKDKYIVMDENSKDTVWWTTEGYPNDNHPMSACQKGTVRQEAVCSRRFLRRQQGYPYGRPFHYGSCLAGTFRKKHVHQAHSGRRKDLRA